MKKKIILVHEQFVSEDTLTDSWIVLIHLLEKRLGFKTVQSMDDLPGDADVVFVITSLRLAQMMRLERLCDLRGPKIILQICDMHKCAYDNLRRYSTVLIDRCDISLSMSDMYFRLLWTDQIKKHVYFPYWFATQERYESLSFQKNPKIRCLLSGNIKEAYPVRKAIGIGLGKKQKGRVKEIVDSLEWPKIGEAKKDGVVTRDAYAKKLNEYLCCVAGTMLGCPVNKHFEIMAAGSLMASDKTWDLDALGLKPQEHYLSVTTLNYFKKISWALNPGNREAVNKIRLAGMEFSRKYHGVEARFNQFKEVLEQLDC